MRRVSHPLATGVTKAESVSIAQGSLEIDTVESGARLDVVEVVQPGAGGKDVGVGTGADL